ncbi:hypothetical protein, partial [Azotobacter beijerinckii]|uniref:hypothetical protein n=1 Tax=Azotobacter beijerinckii TaxID=170623 RepID=UPI002952E293
VCLRLPAYSASAKDSCFIGKLGQGIECISPESGSLFQDFPYENHSLKGGQKTAEQDINSLNIQIYGHIVYGRANP